MRKVGYRGNFVRGMNRRRNSSGPRAAGENRAPDRGEPVKRGEAGDRLKGLKDVMRPDRPRPGGSGDVENRPDPILLPENHPDNSRDPILLPEGHPDNNRDPILLPEDSPTNRRPGGPFRKPGSGPIPGLPDYDLDFGRRAPRNPRGPGADRPDAPVTDPEINVSRPINQAERLQLENGLRGVAQGAEIKRRNSDDLVGFEPWLMDGKSFEEWNAGYPRPDDSIGIEPWLDNGYPIPEEGMLPGDRNLPDVFPNDFSQLTRSQAKFKIDVATYGIFNRNERQGQAARDLLLSLYDMNQNPNSLRHGQINHDINRSRHLLSRINPGPRTQDFFNYLSILSGGLADKVASGHPIGITL